MSEYQVSRRLFLGGAAASPVFQARGANERISVAMIGTGSRGQANMKEIDGCVKAGQNVAITAVCDIYRPNRERAADMAAKSFGAAPRQSTDFREVLAWKDVDAVVICTPDFGHSQILKEAVEAGKDVYCEKPMGIHFAEAKAAYLAVKKSRQVVQIGTQRRSEARNFAAMKLLRSGVLGKLTRIDVSVNFQEPRWRRDYTHVKPADVAWDKFLFNRPAKPFDARELREWQLFRDYTNGIAGLWMCHFSDLVHYFTGEVYPSGAVANGGVFLWKDGRHTSDVFHALLDYPGFLFSFAMSLTNGAGNRNLWFGTRGTLDADRYVVTPDGSRDPDRLESEIRIAGEDVDSHMHNFFECVRSRTAPRADIQAGFSHAVAGVMASTALETGRKVRFDRDKLELV